MKKYYLFAIIILGSVFFISQAASEEFVLDYLEGTMEINQDGSWVEAMIGDAIAPDTQLNVDEETIAEFSGNNIRLTISNPGVYSLQDILKRKKRVSSLGFGTVIQNTYKYVAGNEKNTSSAVMGVRGASVQDPGDVAWMDEEDEQLSDGKDLIKKNKFKEAVSVLKEGFQDADADAEQEYMFYLGYANAMLGNNGKALKYLSGVKADGSETYFWNYVLVKGQLLIDSLSYKKALSLFNSYIKMYPDGENAQVSYFLAGISLKELGREKDARDFFIRAKRINPDSEVGRAAYKAINKL